MALAVDGEPAWSARWRCRPSGWCWVPGPPRPVGPASSPRMVVSRTRPPEFVPFVAERLGADTVPMGSAGAKIAAVIRGEAEVYVHAGGQYEWDSAAPVAVALAGGSTPAAWTARPSGTPNPTRGSPTWWCATRRFTDAVLAALPGCRAMSGSRVDRAGRQRGGDRRCRALIRPVVRAGPPRPAAP